LFAAAICHAGIAALPEGAPVLNGLEVRCNANDSVPDPLLTEAGFGTAVSVDEVPFTLVVV